MNILKILIGLSILLVLFNNCSNKKSDSTPSGSESNSPTEKIGINTDGGWSDSPFISRDGKRLYFMYSRYNFAPWIKSGGSSPPVVEGPDRPGLHKSTTNPWDESDIYMATLNDDGTWSTPVNLGLNGSFGDSSGMEINNGNTFIWLQGNGTTNNVVMANKNSDGSWGSSVDLGSAINNSAGTSRDNPHISPDGRALWFVSNRTDGMGGKDIWLSTNANGTWSNPVNAGPPVNDSGEQDQPWISPVGADVYWNGPNGLMHCLSNGTTCSGTPTVVTIAGCDYPAEVSIPDDGNTMYFACGNFTTFEVKIMHSKKQPNGLWGPAVPVD